MRIGPKTEEMREISTARLRAVGSCSALAAAQEEKPPAKARQSYHCNHLNETIEGRNVPPIDYQAAN